MFNRILKVLGFCVGLLIVIPCILQWIITGINYGMFLLDWSVSDD